MSDDRFKKRMHSSRMRTARSLPYGEGVSLTETPRTETPWTETPPPGQRLPDKNPLYRDPPRTEAPSWMETPGQMPPPGRRPSWMETCENTGENILRKLRLRAVKRWIGTNWFSDTRYYVMPLNKIFIFIFYLDRPVESSPEKKKHRFPVL